MRTKIICTIGPKSCNETMLAALYDEGMRVARLNGSHANLEWHSQAIALIHSVLPNVPILLDIPGRKIRTTQLNFEPSFAVGDFIILTTSLDYDGSEKVPVNYANLHRDLSVGNTIMADDGTLRFTVTKIDGADIWCQAETGGQLKSRKGINVPFVKLSTPQVTERDRSMVDFACANQVDFIGLSFVESSDHVNVFRDLIAGRGPKIVAKIENQGGLDNAEKIVEIADAIMIDRGDLSVETSLFDVALKQKAIISQAKKYGTPVIVATEMLHTMIENSVPTKAEVTDISNAVLDGCAATMLSGETAVGTYPIEAVRTMRRIIEASEQHLSNISDSLPRLLGEKTPDVIANAVPEICRNLPISKIIAITRSGFAARKIDAQQPTQPIIAVSDDELAAKGFNLIPGVLGVFSDISFLKNSTDHVADILKSLWVKKIINDSDTILVVGITYPTAGGRMNSIQIHNVGLLCKTLSWHA